MSNAGRDRAAELVETQIQIMQIMQGWQGGGDWTGETVVGEGEDSEVDEVSELGRDGAGDEAGVEDELSELGEVGEGRGERAGESGGVGEAGAKYKRGDPEGGIWRGVVERADDTGEGGAGAGRGEIPCGEEVSAGNVGEGVLDCEQCSDIQGVEL